MPLQGAQQFGQDIGFGRFVLVPEAFVGDVGDVGGAVGPAAQLDELGFDGPDVAVGQHGVLVNRNAQGVDPVIAVVAEVGSPEVVAVFDDGARAPEIHVYQGAHRLGVSREVADHVQPLGADYVEKVVAGSDHPHHRRGVPDIVGKHRYRLVGGPERIRHHAVEVSQGSVVSCVGAVVGVQGGDYDFGRIEFFFLEVFLQGTGGVADVAAFADDFTGQVGRVFDRHGVEKPVAVEVEQLTNPVFGLAAGAAFVGNHQDHPFGVVVAVEYGLDGRFQHFPALVNGGDNDGVGQFSRFKLVDPFIEKPQVLEVPPGTLGAGRGDFAGVDVSGQGVPVKFHLLLHGAVAGDGPAGIRQAPDEEN